jgi:hypothetical protein
MQPVTELSNELITAFTSRFFDTVEVGKRLSPLLRGSTSWDKVRAAQAVGEALRADDPRRGRAAALAWAREVVDWRGVYTDHQPTVMAHLGAIMAMPRPTPGRFTLCDVSVEEIRTLFRCLVTDERVDVEVGVDLLDWVEFGTREAFGRLQQVSGKGLRLLSIASTGKRAERLYAVAASPHRDDLEAELRWLASSLGHYGMVTTAVPVLAQRLGVGVTQLATGLDCERSTRADLHSEEHKPLIDLLAACPTHHGLLRELIPFYVGNPWISKPCLPDMLEHVPWDERFDALPVGSAGRWGALVLTQKGKRASCKLERTEAAAAKVFAKKRTELETERAAAAPAANDLDRALNDAVMDNVRSDVRRLLRLGAKPDGVVDDGRTALSHRPGEDPVVIDLLADAGCELDRPARDGMALLDLIARADPAWYRLVSAERLLVRGARGTASPIHAAAKRGNAQLVELLLSHGADASAPATTGPHAGLTPLDLARSVDAYATVAVLERAQAG